MTHRERAAIVGVGYSTVGRSTGLTLNELAEAALAAMDDAGMVPGDLDGLATMGGFAIANAWMLGITPLNWFLDAELGPAFLYPAVHAMAAIQTGLCHTCIVLRLIQRQPAAFAMPPAMDGTGGGSGDFLLPFGSISPTNWAGLLTRRHMIEFGTTEEQFAAHAVTQREHALLNDDALVRDPLTVADYLDARYVSKPVRILDCDYPCDAGSAVIFTSEARARDFAKPPVFVESYALVAIYDGFETLPDMTHTAPVRCADVLWSRTGLGPADVDCAQLYDGFTIITFQWLEALGLCKPGDAGPFIAGGNTKLGGALPVNTDGGACNVGRRHGANFCIEAVRQLRGECGARQVPDAHVAVFSNGVGPFAAAALLTNG